MKDFKSMDVYKKEIIFRLTVWAIFATLVIGLVACAQMTPTPTPALSPISIAKQQSVTWMNAYTTVQKNPASTVDQKATAAQVLPLIQAYNAKIHNGVVPTADEGTAINNLINKMKEQGNIK